MARSHGLWSIGGGTAPEDILRSGSIARATSPPLGSKAALVVLPSRGYSTPRTMPELLQRFANTRCMSGSGPANLRLVQPSRGRR